MVLEFLCVFFVRDVEERLRKKRCQLSCESEGMTRNGVLDASHVHEGWFHSPLRSSLDTSPARTLQTREMSQLYLRSAS